MGWDSSQQPFPHLFSHGSSHQHSTFNIQHGNNNLLSLHLLINNVYYPLLIDKPSPLSSTTIVMSSVSFDPAAGVENLRVQQNLCLVKTLHAASTFSLFGNWSAVSRHDQMLRLWLWRDGWWQPFLYATLWYHVCAPCSIATSTINASPNFGPLLQNVICVTNTLTFVRRDVPHPVSTETTESTAQSTHFRGVSISGKGIIPVQSISVAERW